MKQREKFELRKPLVLWSLTLAVFRYDDYLNFLLCAQIMTAHHMLVLTMATLLTPTANSIS